MDQVVRAVIAGPVERPREGWDDPATRGDIAWATLFSADLTPTEALSAGVAELKAGGGSLKAHRHEQPEIYFILSGTGIVTVEGCETRVEAGTAVFIPGNAEHAIRNETDADLRFFYVFPADSFSDVVYRFPPEAGPG